MYQSNIDIVSNVYIREPKSLNGRDDLLQYDPKFVEQVSGIKALKSLMYAENRPKPGIHLTQAQRDELNAGKRSKHCGKGEQPYGLVSKNGEYHWECRCEPQGECPYENECKPHKISRGQRAEKEKTGDGRNLPALEWLGITEETDVFAISASAELEAERDDVPAKETIEMDEIAADPFEYEKITAEQAEGKIIQANVASRIVVNAAPGTGKTYTAIQRLLYLLNRIEPEDFELILVLCYTRAAVGEIQKRLEQGMAEGTIPVEAKQVSVCTFDSLATNYLVHVIETPQEDLMKLDYNGRIRLFNARFNRKDYEDFTYCIIDELQDLVNDRAMMALNIVGALKCGYLLLGDKCQAIYDYDCQGAESIKSTVFYKRLAEILPSDTCQYELTGNKRQSEELRKRTEKLREALLHCDPQGIIQTFREEIGHIPAAGVTAEKYNISPCQGTTAILCRNNGEAEYVSSLLHKNQVEHALIRTAGQMPSLHRFIADIFWDYREKQMERGQFIQRMAVRRGESSDRANMYFDILCETLYGDIRDFLDCQELAKKLCHGGELPPELQNGKKEHLVVSTIHKAKGREFDKVYLLGYDYSPESKKKESDTEEERVIYVAETRPKTKLEMLKKGNRRNWFFRKSSHNRWIRTVRSNPYEEKFYCGGFAVGYAGDLDGSSFVDGSLEQAVERQAYIAERVNLGDEVYLKLGEGIYDIIHGERVIGKTSAEMSKHLVEKFGGRCYVSKLPEAIRHLYVTDITTFVSYKDYENIPQWFRENRFWLGVEISGFGKTEWSGGSR